MEGGSDGGRSLVRQWWDWVDMLTLSVTGWKRKSVSVISTPAERPQAPIWSFNLCYSHSVRLFKIRFQFHLKLFRKTRSVLVISSQPPNTNTHTHCQLPLRNWNVQITFKIFFTLSTLNRGMLKLFMLVMLTFTSTDKVGGRGECMMHDAMIFNCTDWPWQRTGVGPAVLQYSSTDAQNCTVALQV